jgi:hypothetical protein
MVERFNGRVGSEVLGITIYSHKHLEQLLRGFNAAYNARRQRVLGGKTPDQVVAERLKARRKLINPKPHGRAGPDDITKACLIAEAAKEVSQPDNSHVRRFKQQARKFIACLGKLFSVAATGQDRRHDLVTTVDHALMRGLVAAGPVMRRGASSV